MAAQVLYEELYCARGEMENRIKEQFNLFADRVSGETMRANQLRMYFSAMAYVLVCGLRRLGLKGTEMENSASGHDSHPLAEDRRPGASECAAGSIWRWQRVTHGRVYLNRFTRICGRPLASQLTD